MSWRELLPPWLVIVAGLTGIVLLCVSTKDVPITPSRTKVRASTCPRGGQAGGQAGQRRPSPRLWGCFLRRTCLFPCASWAFKLKPGVFCCFLHSLHY